MGFIPAFIIGLVISAGIWGLRFMIWKEEVPEIISKFRWVIAIAIGITLIAVELSAGLEPESQIVNGFIVYVIAGALDND